MAFLFILLVVTIIWFLKTGIALMFSNSTINLIVFVTVMFIVLYAATNMILHLNSVKKKHLDRQYEIAVQQNEK